MEPLPEGEVETALQDVPEWHRDGIHIERRIHLDDFAEALDLVNRIGALAEEQNHHPDLCIENYNQVRIRVTTHDAGGLTGRDFKLARAIDDLEV